MSSSTDISDVTNFTLSTVVDNGIITVNITKEEWFAYDLTFRLKATFTLMLAEVLFFVLFINGVLSVIFFVIGRMPYSRNPTVAETRFYDDMEDEDDEDETEGGTKKAKGSNTKKDFKFAGRNLSKDTPTIMGAKSTNTELQSNVVF